MDWLADYRSKSVCVRACVVETGYVIEPILPGIFKKMSINMCSDMSDMFVSSLWKGDFDKLNVCF